MYGLAIAPGLSSGLTLMANNKLNSVLSLFIYEGGIDSRLVGRLDGEPPGYRSCFYFLGGADGDG
jgi:hypothetical protein